MHTRWPRNSNVWCSSYLSWHMCCCWLLCVVAITLKASNSFEKQIWNIFFSFFLLLSSLCLSLSPNLLFISTYIKYTFSCFIPLLVCASSKTFRTFCTSTILYTLCFLSNVIVVLLSRQLQYVCCSRLSLFC